MEQTASRRPYVASARIHSNLRLTRSYSLNVAQSPTELNQILKTPKRKRAYLTPVCRCKRNTSTTLKKWQQRLRRFGSAYTLIQKPQPQANAHGTQTWTLNKTHKYLSVQVLKSKGLPGIARQTPKRIQKKEPQVISVEL